MDVIVFLIALFVSGLLVGALARLALPGKDPMGIGRTALIGIAGSFAAGLVSLAIFGEPRSGGIVISVLFATVIVYLVRRSRGGSLTEPGAAPGRGERL